MSKIAFLFPGQGAQFVGMGRQLLEKSAVARGLFAQAADVLRYDLAQVCVDGPTEKLDSTVYSQPALFVTSLAALEVLREESPEIVESAGAAAGLSLGEYSALVFAGALSFEDALRVVQQRGQAMQDAADAVASGMVSILGMEREAVQSLCDDSRQEGEVLQIANLLCPGNIVVSGTKAACERVALAAAERGAMKAIPLAVAGAFHTSIMQPAVARLGTALAEVPIASPRIPVVSNVDARPHHEPDELRDLLVRQVVSPVRWEESINLLISEGFDTFREVGPGRVLCGLMKRINRKIPCENIPC